MTDYNQLIEMLNYFKISFKELAEITGNSERSLKIVTKKSFPRNLKFALWVFNKMKK